MDANGREFRLLHKLSEQAEANDFRWVEGEARAGSSVANAAIHSPIARRSRL